jgi:hypothetical protein
LHGHETREITALQRRISPDHIWLLDEFFGNETTWQQEQEQEQQEQVQEQAPSEGRREQSIYKRSRSHLVP